MCAPPIFSIDCKPMRHTVTIRFVPRILLLALCVCILRTLIPAALPFVSMVALSAREVYESNAVGVIVRRLSPDTPTTRRGYVLVVDEDGAARTERLYHDGALARMVRYVISGRTETESIFKSGVINQQNVYDSDQRLLSSTMYDEQGQQTQTVTYTHGRNLITAEHFDGQENMLFREQRRIDQNGRITGITRMHSNGRMEAVEFLFLGRQLLREIHRLDDLTVIIFYDTSGRLVKEEHRIANNLQREVVYSYDANIDDRIANTVFSTEITDGVTYRIESTNNDQGQQITQLTYEDDILTEEASFEYEQGRLASSRIHLTGSTSQRQFIYDEQGNTTEERWYDNGVLVRAVSIEDEKKNTRTELRHINGRPYVRIYFENGVRVREEFLTEDSIIRERILE